MRCSAKKRCALPCLTLWTGTLCLSPSAPASGCLRGGSSKSSRALPAKRRPERTRVFPHKLRHTAATLMYQGGVDMLALKEILGHENVSTTQIYTHINREQLKKAVAASPAGHPEIRGAKSRQHPTPPIPMTVKAAPTAVKATDSASAAANGLPAAAPCPVSPAQHARAPRGKVPSPAALPSLPTTGREAVRPHRSSVSSR